MTYDFDVVGHPGQGNSLLDKGFPGFRSKHLVAGQHDVELSQAAEEEGGTKSGKYGPRALWSEFYMSLGSLYVRQVNLPRDIQPP